VDDASADGTTEYLKEHESALPDTVLVRHERNQGKGMAIRTGLNHAFGDIILIQDADLEYDPAEIPRLLEPLAAGRAAVVYGSRFLGQIRRMKPANRVANYLLAGLVSLLYGQRLTDEATAYKAFRGEIIKAIPLTCRRFEFCPEVTAKILRRKIPILEVPVSYTARVWEEGKKIGWRDFITAVRVLIENRF
jgi:glycosyltransferase involved in cell wall biosynthesis